MNQFNLSAAQLRPAAAIKDEMEKLHEELTRILGTAAPAPAAPAALRRRTMSAAARPLISAAQWKRSAAKRRTSAVAKPKARRTMIAAAGKKLSDFQKARWAKLKAAMRLYASVGGTETPKDQVMITFPLTCREPR